MYADILHGTAVLPEEDQDGQAEARACGIRSRVMSVDCSGLADLADAGRRRARGLGVCLKTADMTMTPLHVAASTIAPTV